MLKLTLWVLVCCSDFYMPIFEDSGRCRGTAKITYSTPAEANASFELNGHEIGGRWLSVEKAQAKQPGTPGKRDNGPSDKTPSASCFMGNLSYDVTEDAIREAFGSTFAPCARWWRWSRLIDVLLSLQAVVTL